MKRKHMPSRRAKAFLLRRHPDSYDDLQLPGTILNYRSLSAISRIVECRQAAGRRLCTCPGRACIALAEYAESFQSAVRRLPMPNPRELAEELKAISSQITRLHLVQPRGSQTCWQPSGSCANSALRRGAIRTSGLDPSFLCKTSVLTGHALM